MVDKTEMIAWGRECLQEEAKALADAAGRLGENFARAAELILNCRGKVVVTGLGKSGHVARKVASTLASTGTPSFFLHPGEAMHGDLGMIGEQDCLVAIAFGGETAEVISVAKFARRSGVPLISLTGKLDSSLAQLATVVIDASVEHEVCPHNLAPTCSSTLALALGDALAVSVMRARGFASGDFARLHPAGSLGRRLAVVNDFLRTQGQLTVPFSANFHAVLEAITSQNYGVVGVLNDQGTLAGVISDGDIRRQLLKSGEKTLGLSANEMMHPKPKLITAQQLALDALKQMEGHQITSLFVVDQLDQPKLLGLIKLQDLIEAGLV